MRIVYLAEHECSSMQNVNIDLAFKKLNASSVQHNLIKYLLHIVYVCTPIKNYFILLYLTRK